MRSTAPVRVRVSTTTVPEAWPQSDQSAPAPPRYRRLRLLVSAALTLALAVPVWQSLHPSDGAAALSAPVVVEEGIVRNPGVAPADRRVQVVPVVGPGDVSAAAPDVDPGPASPAGDADAPPAGVSACTAPCTTAQVVSVTVLPGPFTVEAGVLTLRRDGDVLVGETTAKVTDLRGSAVPWTLAVRWDGTATDPSGRALAVSSLRVEAQCVKTDGPLTVAAVDPVTATGRGTVAICEAPVVAEGSLAGGLVDVTVRVSASGVGDIDVLDGARLGWTWVLAAA